MSSQVIITLIVRFLHLDANAPSLNGTQPTQAASSNRDRITASSILMHVVDHDQ